jgi:GNAT superfamily N-acetyltransferase
VRGAEYDAVGELTVAAYRAIPGAPAAATDGYASQLRDVASRVAAGCEVVVAVAPDGSLAGGVTYVGDSQNSFAEFDDPEAAGFRMLAVSPSHQGSGAGTALTSWCVDRARSAARRRIIISSTQWMTTAHRIYERVGFLRMPELDWSPVPGFVLMTFVLELS